MRGAREAANEASLPPSLSGIAKGLSPFALAGGGFFVSDPAAGSIPLSVSARCVQDAAVLCMPLFLPAYRAVLALRLCYSSYIITPSKKCL